jgi:type II secretory pathway component GspD/PulD (secretin)
VSQLLRQEGELHGVAGTAAKGGPALRVAIAANTVTNCLVISGTPEAVEEVRLLAEKLDMPAPMVQFEMEMGEAPVGDAKHGEALASAGGAPPAERPNAFRILERPKTMQTTARARVLTLDNQPAFIQLGQRVPRVAGISNTAVSGTTQSVTMANVGLILGVTPRINVKEGIVVLQVDAEDSQVGPEKEGIPLSAAGDKAVRSPRIDSVTVQTTVMIPDGKTIILGSIARQGKTDKELVIILTPHIIPPEGGKKTGP